MTQEKFNLLVEECIKNDSMEDAWNLYFDNDEFDPEKIEDFYIKKKSSYYLAELISINSGSINLDRLIDKIIASKDIDLIGEIALDNLIYDDISYIQREKLKKAADELKSIV